MSTSSRNPDIMDSEVYRVRTPNGTLTAIIIENHDHTINSFQLLLGKAGNDISPWCDALAGIMTLAINNGVKIDQLINCLNGLTSGREARSLGSTCRSGPEGVWMALMRYKRSKFEATNVNTDDNTRGASVAAWARTRDR